MATKLSTLKEDRLFFEELYDKAHPNTLLEHKEHARQLTEVGEIQIETMLENAIANVNGNIKRISVDGKDFDDGSDAKKTVSRTHSYGKAHGINISNVHTKIGTLRVMALNKITTKFLYFAIPHEAYKHITSSTNNIEIPIDMETGELITDYENRRGKNPKVIWAEYQVGSFEEMAKAK